MALTSSVGNGIDCGSSAVLDDLTAFTYCGWIKPNTLADFAGLLFKDATTGGGSIRNFFVMANGSFRTTVKRATTDSRARSATGILVNGTHAFVATTYDSTDGARLYAGSLSSAVAETSYEVGFPEVGSGAEGSDAAGNVQIAQEAQIDVSSFMVFNRRLTVTELIHQQWRRHPASGLVLWIEPGLNGSTTTVPDLSGNGNTGTGTGQTIANHVPLASPFPWGHLDTDEYFIPPPRRFILVRP